MPNLHLPKKPRVAKTDEPTNAQGFYFSGAGEVNIPVGGGQVYVDLELSQGSAYAWIAGFDGSSTQVNVGTGTYTVNSPGGMLTVVFITGIGGVVWGNSN